MQQKHGIKDVFKETWQEFSEKTSMGKIPPLSVNSLKLPSSSLVYRKIIILNNKEILCTKLKIEV